MKKSFFEKRKVSVKGDTLKVKIKKERLGGPIMFMVTGVATLTAGILMIVFSKISFNIVFKLFALYSLVIGVLGAVSFIVNPHKRTLSTGISSLGLVGLAFCFWFFTKNMLTIFILLIGLYAVINFIWRAISVVQLIQTRDIDYIRRFIEAIISVGVAIFLFLFPFKSQQPVCIFFGVYTILTSITYFSDAIREIFLWDTDGKHIKRKIKLKIPAILTFFIPLTVFNNINKSLNDYEDEIQKISYIRMRDRKRLDSSHLEVFIHTSPKTGGGFGHVDICVDNTVYTYGAYDHNTNRLFGLLSDGVFAVMDREKYIKYCLTQKNENIVSFNIYLTDEQLVDIHKYIDEYMTRLYRWQCDKEKNPNGDFHDKASKFYTQANAKLYKYKKGKYKTYFLISTNCVSVADELIGSSGINVISLNGIITPGTYLTYLNREFKRNNSFVTKKTIFSSPEMRKKQINKSSQA
ncbi:MAG: DUF308 domain-containing protein [Acutalibacteraceae bacterium]|nr:DUF308 domain-containing protein [Acutalibacteraceae bacterium]